MIILNGEVVEDNKINMDSGYTFGRGVFETILVKDKPLFLKEHMDRLNVGIIKLGIEKCISEDYVLEHMAKLQCKNCALKIMVSENNIILQKREIPYTKEHYEKGFSLKVSSVKRNPYSHLTYIKSLNYIDNIIELEKAKSEGFNEVLFQNIDNSICEGSISNIFIIDGDSIITPSTDCGLLEGVVRNFLLNKLKDNYDIYEDEITLRQTMRADGVFVTNSLLGVMKVSSINNREINQSSLVEDIRKIYEEYIEI